MAVARHVNSRRSRPKPNERVTSRKVEAFDFAEEPKGEKKRAKTAVRVGKRSRIHGDFVSPDRKAKSTDRRRSRCKCCVVRIFGYFAAHDVNVGFRPYTSQATGPSRWRMNASMLRASPGGGRVVDVQPAAGACLSDAGGLPAVLEVPVPRLGVAVPAGVVHADDAVKDRAHEEGGPAASRP
jgi:hypothetical protein